MRRRNFLVAGALACVGLVRPTLGFARGSSPLLMIEGAKSSPFTNYLVTAVKQATKKYWNLANPKFLVMNHQGNVDRALNQFGECASKTDCLCVLGGGDWNVASVLTQEAAVFGLPYGVVWASNTHFLNAGNGWATNFALQDHLLFESLLMQMRSLKQKTLSMLLVDDAVGRSFQDAALMMLPQYPEIELLGIDWHARGDMLALNAHAQGLNKLGTQAVLIGTYPSMMPAVWGGWHRLSHQPDIYLGLSTFDWGANEKLWRPGIRHYVPYMQNSSLFEQLAWQVESLMLGMFPTDEGDWHRLQLHNRIKGLTSSPLLGHHQWVLQA